MAKVQGWVMLDPGKMELQTFDTPKIEEDGVLLKVDACGICGSDVHASLGHIRTGPGSRRPELPALRPMLVLFAYAPPPISMYDPDDLWLQLHEEPPELMGRFCRVYLSSPPDVGLQIAPGNLCGKSRPGGTHGHGASRGGAGL
jgi:hypothetical protein